MGSRGSPLLPTSDVPTVKFDTLQLRPRSYALGTPQRGHSLLRVSYVIVAAGEG